MTDDVASETAEEKARVEIKENVVSADAKGASVESNEEEKVSAEPLTEESGRTKRPNGQSVNDFRTDMMMINRFLRKRLQFLEDALFIEAQLNSVDSSLYSQSFDPDNVVPAAIFNIAQNNPDLELNLFESLGLFSLFFLFSSFCLIVFLFPDPLIAPLCRHKDQE